MAVAKVEPYRRQPDAFDYTGRVLLFLSSYAPLFALVAVRTVGGGWFFLFAVVMTAAGVFALLRVLDVSRRVETRTVRIGSPQDRGADVAGYVVAYFLPIIIDARPDVAEAIAYVGFLVISGVIYVRSNLVHLNPLLYLLRYRIFAVTAEPGGDQLLAARGELRDGDERRVVGVTAGLLVDAGRRATDG